VDAGAEYPPHVIAGLVGGDDFIFATPIRSRATTNLVFDALGLVADAGRGTLIVNLETLALQAASGGLVDIDAGSDAPFIAVHGVAQAGNELIFEAGPAITFPNVEVGDVTISITPPDTAICLTHPALEADDLRTFEVKADTVTVVVFICQ
jgi:hypothetical protein